MRVFAVATVMVLAPACAPEHGAAAADDVDGHADGPTACNELPRGPVEPRRILSGLIGSEDMTFDGLGNVALRVRQTVRLVNAKGETRVLVESLPGSFGLRFRANGHIAAALPGQGQLIDIDPDGAISVVAENLQLPNGVFPDRADNIWVTEMRGNRVIKVTPDGAIEVLAEGDDAPAVNGVVLDEKRNALFYSQFGTGIIIRVDLADASHTPVTVSQLPDARPDGLALDACGNLYAVDNGGARLFRVFLDEGGNATEDPELVASFPSSVANPLFGIGAGFASTSLFVIGVAGDLYEVPLAVTGAAVVVPGPK